MGGAEGTEGGCWEQAAVCTDLFRFSGSMRVSA